LYACFLRHFPLSVTCMPTCSRKPKWHWGRCIWELYTFFAICPGTDLTKLVIISRESCVGPLLVA
jgi:hypothetical protein